MISAIILAAGKSERMGKCKQLLEFNGHTFIKHVIENVSNSNVDEVIVVLGFMADEIKKEIGNKRVKIVVNRNYELGMSTSLKVGLNAVDKNAEAALFVLGDQPFIEFSIINKLINAYKRGKAPIVVPVYKGKRGNPVLLDRTLFNEIETITGDTGARSLIQKYKTRVLEVKVNSPSVLIDIDTLDEFETSRKLAMLKTI